METLCIFLWLGERRGPAARKRRPYSLRTLGDSPKLRIIDFFLDNPLFDFTKKEVIEALGMSKQTFYKYFRDLEAYEIVKVSRKIGRVKLYRINLDHPLVEMLRRYEEKLSLMLAEKEAGKAAVEAPA